MLQATSVEVASMPELPGPAPPFRLPPNPTACFQIRCAAVNVARKVTAKTTSAVQTLLMLCAAAVVARADSVPILESAAAVESGSAARCVVRPRLNAPLAAISTRVAIRQSGIPVVWSAAANLGSVAMGSVVRVVRFVCPPFLVSRNTAAPSN